MLGHPEKPVQPPEEEPEENGTEEQGKEGEN